MTATFRHEGNGPWRRARRSVTGTQEKGGLGAEWNREEEEMASEEGLEGSGNMDIVRAGTKHLNLCQHLVKSSFKSMHCRFLVEKFKHKKRKTQPSRRGESEAGLRGTFGKFSSQASLQNT